MTVDSKLGTARAKPLVATVLEVRGLTVAYTTGKRAIVALRDVSLRLAAGELGGRGGRGGSAGGAAAAGGVHGVGMRADGPHSAPEVAAERERARLRGRAPSDGAHEQR